MNLDGFSKGQRSDYLIVLKVRTLTYFRQLDAATFPKKLNRKKNVRLQIYRRVTVTQEVDQRG